MGLLDFLFAPFTQAGTNTQAAVTTPPPGTPAAQVVPSPSFTPISSAPMSSQAPQPRPSTPAPTPQPSIEREQQIAQGTISPVSMRIYDMMAGVAGTIRRGIPEVSRRLEQLPVIGKPAAFVTSRTNEQFARLSETVGMIPGGTEVLVKRPQLIAPATIHGTSETIRSTAEELRTDPAMFGAGLVVTGITLKGISTLPRPRLPEAFHPTRINAFAKNEAATYRPPIEVSRLQRAPEVKPKRLSVIVADRPVVLESLKNLTTRADVKPVTAVKSKVETKLETRAKPKVEVKPLVKTQPKLKVQTMTAVRPKIFVMPRVSTKLNTAVAPKTLTKTKLQVEPRTQTQTQVKTEPTVKMATKTMLKPATATALSLKVSPATKLILQTTTKILTRAKTGVRTQLYRPLIIEKKKLKKKLSSSDSFGDFAGSSKFGKFKEISNAANKFKLLKGL